MLTSLHLLLTYRCVFACDHCFVFAGPRAEGVFTIARIRAVLDQATALGGITDIYFEGGEPGLYYSLLLAGISAARSRGFGAGIVTNGYWALSEEDAADWLRPLMDAGLRALDISNDDLHYGEADAAPVRHARAAAARLGLPCSALGRRRPFVETGEDGQPRVSGGVKFRGRAAETLTTGLPRHPAAIFTQCPFETLADPGRVHVDPFGWVHLCQGLTMGNCLATPLPALVAAYRAAAHPIVGPLVAGGPAALAETFGFRDDAGFVDACHLCYTVRKALRARWPEYLQPGQVYGESD